MSCSIRYEVWRQTSVGRKAVTFVSKTKARQFQRANPGSRITPFKVCDVTGRIERRSSRAFGRSRR